MRQLPIMGGWYFCAFAGSTYDGAEISTQKGHKSDALALLATIVLVLRVHSQKMKSTVITAVGSDVSKSKGPVCTGDRLPWL